MSSSEYSSTYVMEDSGFEDSGDTYGDYLRNSDSSSNTSSIYQLPPAARIRTLDQLINALLIEDQKQRQGDPSAELNPMPIERLPIPGNKENQRLSDSSSNTSSINQSPPAARITSLDQLINVLLNQAQKQQQGDPSAKLNPIPIERLPIPGNKENQRLVQWDSDDSSNTSSIYQLPPAARITSLDQLINILEKENQKQQQGDPSAKLNLIPIERLPIPGNKENQRLVQWDSDDSEEDIINFFPVSRKETRVHQEISDTFSIEEMSISGEDDDDEEDLHLIPPQTTISSFSCCKCEII
ncbi:hypothetical protein WA026_022441 [Henosepilachna vigintioctopunctata]|uniref:Uncharacterized protein n=1 Tax=Henosepilachna vigintioctopunctata TaxID=420089 RepID=A0AAW1UD52_9CUCU